MENNKISRNQIHEKLMICTYQYLFYVSMNDKQDLSLIINSSFKNNSAKNDPFVKDYMIKMISNFNNIIDKIGSHLKETWTFDRLGFMEKSILLLGYIEILYLNVPKPVVNNICVKLAKTYCDDNQYKFINAILEKA